MRIIAIGLLLLLTACSAQAPLAQRSASAATFILQTSGTIEGGAWLAGANYEVGLPHTGVDLVAGFLHFSPGSSPAYVTYCISPDLNDGGFWLRAKWWAGTDPGKRLWVGLANWEQGRWDWYDHTYLHPGAEIPDAERYLFAGWAYVILLIAPDGPTSAKSLEVANAYELLR
jgi:hypothetical protein